MSGNSLGRTILIIDDADMERFFLRREIRKAELDLDLIEFTYAEEAIGYLRRPSRENVDLILVDINMPRMSGFEFSDAFHNLYPELKGDARLYMVSSSINPEDQQRAAEHPAVEGFLHKPVSRETLAEICS